MNFKGNNKNPHGILWKMVVSRVKKKKNTLWSKWAKTHKTASVVIEAYMLCPLAVSTHHTVNSGLHRETIFVNCLTFGELNISKQT